MPPSASASAHDGARGTATMTTAESDARLEFLLGLLDPQATLPLRHIWLIKLMAWVRGDGKSASAAVGRVRQFLDAVEARPGIEARLREWWAVFVRTVELTALLADHGFSPRSAFVSAFGERLQRKLVPGTPETIDASSLLRMALPGNFDAAWIQQLDAELLRRIARLAPPDLVDGVPHWQHLVMDAITFCATQVVAAGFSSELRLRMSDPVRAAEPFHELMVDLDRLRVEAFRRPRDPEALQAAFRAFRGRLDRCREAAASVYAHLEDNGISVGLVFRLRQLRARMVRIRDLLDCLLSPQPHRAIAQMLARLVLASGERYSIRALIASNASMLAAKVAERSAEVGEHYITRDRAAYRGMLLSAAGGGFITGFTVLLKFGVVAIALSEFWSGFAVGILYSVSFIVIQLTHATLATKQPAMTAPAIAAKLKNLNTDDATEAFVDEVTHLVRSQVAAVLGNVLLVAPTALLLYLLLSRFMGVQPLDEAHARETLESLHVYGILPWMAAITGVVLFASSLFAGWAENVFVLNRIDSAMRYNPRIRAALGVERAARWAVFMRTHISGFAANISLGFMLGLVPVVAEFFGLPIQVPHVTLSTGLIVVAAATLGPSVLGSSLLWWSVAAIPVLGVLNLSVSFYCAVRLAMRAHSISRVERARLDAALRARLRRRPASFLLPP